MFAARGQRVVCYYKSASVQHWEITYALRNAIDGVNSVYAGKQCNPDISHMVVILHWGPVHVVLTPLTDW